MGDAHSVRGTVAQSAMAALARRRVQNASIAAVRRTCRPQVRRLRCYSEGLPALEFAGVLFDFTTAPSRVNILEKSPVGWFFPFRELDRPTKTTPSSIARRLL